jgi:hypothetical protein
MKRGKRKTDEERVLAIMERGDGSAYHKPVPPRGPSFKTTDKDYLLIAEIAKRAVILAHKLGKDYDCTTVSMDVTACHANGNPLRLDDLLKADDGNFGHDVFGINRFIDRSTGKLTDFFRPRYSIPKGRS